MIARHMAHSPSLPPATYGNYPGADPYGAGEAFPPTAGGDPYSPHYNSTYPAYTQEPVYSLNPGDTFPPTNPIAPSGSAGSAMDMDPATAHNTYLNRQPTIHDTEPVPQQYMDMNRVASPPASAMRAAAEYDPGLMSPTSATPLRNPHEVAAASSQPPTHAPVPATAPPYAPAPAPIAHQVPVNHDGFKRPETVYDPEDAYGGM
jgi:hypothetical protein